MNLCQFKVLINQFDGLKKPLSIVIRYPFKDREVRTVKGPPMKQFQRSLQPVLSGISVLRSYFVTYIEWTSTMIQHDKT